MDDTINSRVFLRERFLKFITSNRQNQACSVRMHENTTVQANIKAFDASFEHILVENLQTPCPPSIPSAILRVNGRSSMGKLVLTHAQQKSSLKARKTTSQNTAKRLLTNRETKFHPGLDTVKSKVIIDAVTSLPRLKPEKFKVLYKSIKKVPKEKRKATRAKIRPKFDIPKDTKASLVLGVNEVTKLLEAHEADTILISSDTEPLNMVRHIIDMAARSKTPTLIVEDLRNALAKTVGISSMALAIKKDATCKILLQINKTASSLFSKFEIPQHYECYNNLLASNGVEMPIEKLTLTEEEKSAKKEPVKNCLLVRGDATSRVFQPPRTTQLSAKRSNDQRMNIGMGRIKPEYKKSKYRGVAVKQIKKNQNRHGLKLPKHLV